MLGDFAEDFVLAHRIGDLTASPFILNRVDDFTGFAADHPMEITGAQIDGLETAGYERAIVTDGDGHTWTVVKFAAAVPAGAVMSATGKGLLNPRTGALMENAAEVMEYVSRLAGRSDIFPLLRSEVAERGLRIAGSIGAGLKEPPKIRDVLDMIAGSVGAIWTVAGARVFPAPVSGLVLDVTKMDGGELDVSQTLDDTADVLRITFDESDALGGALQFIELTASPATYGGVVAERFYPMLRDPTSAELVGRVALQRMAGRRYAIKVDTERTDLRPGSWIRLDLPEWPTLDAQPTVMVLEVDIAQSTNSTRAQGECLLTSPDVAVTARTVKVPTKATAGIEVSVRNGVAYLRITDSDRRPIKDARVSLDGGAAKTTDATGSVSFDIGVTAEPVDHELAIEATGKVPQTLTVRL